jgi:ribonuclease E
LRLRDLAGLIVIDFIDMESKRHNAMVERRMKDALKDDRARIQLGHISHFGLMEMSRQRLRPSLEETTLIICQHCNGTGHVRGTESAALHVLRGVEEEAGKRRSAEVIVHVATAIALYILNHKRERLNEIERRYGMRVIIAADDALIAPRFRIERLRTLAPGEEPRFVTPDAPRAAVSTVAQIAAPEPMDADDDDDVSEAEDDEADEAAAAGTGEDTEESREAERRRRRRRRRRRGGREDDVRAPDGAADVDAPPEPVAAADVPAPEVVAESVTAEDDARRRSRRGRGRRGGRPDGDLSPLGVPGAEQPDLVPVYAGPTPADPFGSGHVFDIFDVMEQAELNAAPVSRAQPGRRGAPPGRSRWQPPHWSVASEPPMLATERAASDRPDRGPPAESWALASRPFMLRRDRHAPRWARDRNAPSHRSPAPEPVVPVAAPASQEEAVASHARPVPIEAGPPPALEPVNVPVMRQSETVETAAASSPETAPTSVEFPAAVQAELPWSDGEATPVAATQAAPEEATQMAAAKAVAEEPTQVAATEAAAEEATHVAAAPAALEPQPVPANDVVAGPVVQPIVIGSDSAPPTERKRGWWRLRS